MQSEPNMHRYISIPLAMYFKLSIHFFLGLPLHRFPGIPSSYCRLASLSSSMCSTFSFYVLCLLNVSTTASWLSLFLISSFQTWSIFVSPSPPQIAHLTCLQPALLSLLHCPCFTSIFNRVATTIALNTFIFVSFLNSLLSSVSVLLPQ